MADAVVEAAGGVLWRSSHAGPEIAVVHRPRYDDWSLPKGKLWSGEYPLLGALREVEEETGYVGRPGRTLGEISYLKGAAPKRVRYWAMQACIGSFSAGDEVDELRWLPLPEALARLDPRRDRSILAAFAVDVRPTMPCIVVRHASAADASSWSGDEIARPLDDRGHRQASALVPVLIAFAARRVVSADVARCVDTVQPFATARGVEVETENLLSEDGYHAGPDAALERALGLIGTGEPLVLCGQGNAISPLVQEICSDLGGPPLEGAVAKGGFVVLHFAAEGRRELVAVDSYPPVL